MRANAPVVLTVTEAEDLIALFRDLEKGTEVQGYGPVCFDCGRGLHEEPHDQGCKVLGWLTRLGPWEKKP